MPVPTERNLIKLWKESCGAAEKVNADIGVGRWPLSRSSGVLCSFYPWKEMLFISSTGSKATTGSLLADRIDHSKLDKRELLKLLQQSCPVEFLRQHGLNGSEALILKKKNRDAIGAAYGAWLAQNESEFESGAEIAVTDSTAQSATYTKLLSTCKVLLKGILNRFYKTNDLSKLSDAGAIVGTLLLLHEDYPHELPVFSKPDTNTVENMPVVCAMGAVRDATDEEVRALIEAATSLKMRCVGANLGRTAEFTSKIVTALVSHAKEERLQRAVSLLPSVESHTRGAAAVSKLAPQRTGAWSWDGESNKHKISGEKKRKHVALSEDIPGEPVQGAAARSIQHHMHIVAWLHIDVSAVTEDVDRREAMLGLVQLIVTSLWRSRLASEAAHEKDGAGSSADTAKPSEQSQEQVTGPKVVPMLHLVFKDGRVATLTQARLAIAMANQHMAAPSEYQVLHMLLSLLRDPAVLTSPTRVSSGDSDGVGGILAHVLPGGLRKSERKAVRVVELTDTAPVSHVSAHASFGGKPCHKNSHLVVKTGSEGELSVAGGSLAQCGYAGPCGCSGDAHGTEDADVHVVVLLNRSLKQPSPSLDSVADALFAYVYPDKEVPSDASKVQKRVADMMYCGSLFTSKGPATLTAPSIAITILQHFAYHDRLRSAIDLAIAQKL